MYKIIDKKDLKIENMIYEVRGKQVMLDSDLAYLYHCANGTKTINQAVKRHIDRFPERYMFRLTKEEYYSILRSQSGTLELEQGQYSKYLPYAFTEEGSLIMIKDLECRVILISGKNTKLSKLDIDRYNKTYNNLSIYCNDTYHDRYFIIDKDKIYHSGNSINHIGYRKSSINVLMDKSIKKTILKDIDNIIKI